MFEPENLWVYTRTYFDFEAPVDEPIVHFILGSRPSFTKGQATTQPETPLTIGIGKAQNLIELAKRWEIDPASVTFRTDDIRNDGPSLERFGTLDSRIITNPPVDQVEWARRLALKVERPDFERPQFSDIESQRIQEEARKTYRIEIIREIAANLLRRGKV
jgi:hypothetical protein